MHPAADRIRNVALVGHRGSGKTSLHEALLFEAGAINRLGSVPDQTTVSDSDPDEQARQMSISATLSSLTWQERKINLLDTPGEPSFIADALGSLRVCESAVFVVNAVMGVEVTTTRLWARAAELERRAARIGRTSEDLRRSGAAGSPEEVAERLAEYGDAGASRSYLQVIDLDDLDHVALIASEVMPKLS